jgi:hypothetical protein
LFNNFNIAFYADVKKRLLKHQITWDCPAWKEDK